MNENNLPVKYIIAPHEIHEQGITQLQESIKGKTVRYTSMNESEIKEANVLIIDTIGILSSVYQYGNVAYIGGGFGKGIHNILEAATFGLPIIFGPNFKKFREANELIKLNGAFLIKNSDDLNTIIITFIKNHQAFKTAGENTREYVRRNLGATDIITKFVRSSL
jgi:3-deoxy-D-manno-octulosonic-acid transferase